MTTFDGEGPVRPAAAIGDLVARVEAIARSAPSEPPVVEGGGPDSGELAVARGALARRRWEAAVPARFRDATPGSIPDHAAHDIRGWMLGSEPRPNLVLFGAVGVGKSWTACAAVRPLVEAGRTMAFWPVVRLLDHLRPGDRPDPYADAVTVDLLILDDVGAERATEWTAERLYALVNDRWLDQLPTVATSNLTAPQLTAAVGDRLASRLLGGAVTTRLIGPDRRRRG